MSQYRSRFGLLHLFRSGLDTNQIATHMKVEEAFIYNTLWGQREQEFSNRAALPARDTAAGVAPPFPPSPPIRAVS